MSRLERTVYYHARITLEATTPLSVGSGRRDAIYDCPVVTDANGLPVIPGTALAGVIRQAYADTADDKAVRNLFGYAGEDSAASRVEVSFGHIHNQNNQPVDGRVDSSGLEQDALLGTLLQDLPFRDNVKLNHRGVATETGKFDRSYVPAGHRFTFDMAFWSGSTEDADWKNLLSLLHSPAFRLGGATRRGFGEFKLVAMDENVLQLAKGQDLSKLAALNRKLQAAKTPVANRSQPRHQFVELNADIRACDYWMMGSGDQAIQHQSSNPDKVAVSEKIVQWTGNQGRYTEKAQVVVPASGIKGALRHRLAFHYNRLTGVFAEGKTEQELNDLSEQNPATQAIFGYVAPKANDACYSGAISMSDIYLAPETLQAQVLQHNSIDRFTGGVRNHVLFSEELLYQGPELKIKLAVHLPTLKRNLALARADADKVLAALASTLDDLTQERLAIGHGSAKGYGYFAGQWNKDKLANLAKELS